MLDHWAPYPFECLPTRRQGTRDLTVVSNNAGNGEKGPAALLATGNVRKIVCSIPRQKDSSVFDALYRAGEIELEILPRGNLAERMRAAGAGIGAFYCPTGVGTPLGQGKEARGSWKQTIARLADSGWTAIALDLRGHGDSDWHPAARTPSTR